MPQLIGLDASHNRISGLPDDAFKKTGIIYLHLSWNLFSEIPLPLKRLKHGMEVLDISNNYISCLPNWFAKTGCIQELILSNNMLWGIDVSLLKKLCQSECSWSLYLTGNPIEMAVKDSLHSYLKAYFQYDSDEGKKYYDFVHINW
jgi:Leucine-rich repeat (LRR) protein